MSKVLANRAKTREYKRAEVLDWYLANNFQIPPDVQCEDKKAYNDKVLWWLEPPIPNIDNPVLIEEAMGDGWGLRLEWRKS